MKSIEDAFQTLADRIVSGHSSFTAEESETITRMWTLWSLRFRYGHNAIPDQPINGIVPDPLTPDQQELLEKRRVAYLQSDGTMPGRVMTGLRIQTELDWGLTRLGAARWGVMIAGQGEFALPDNTGEYVAIPLTPALLLSANQISRSLPRDEVKRANRALINAAATFVIAHDFDEI